MPRVALHTLGCKLNFAESSTIGGQFLERGYDVVDFGEPADVVVINTCSVTERADRECRQLIRRALRTSTHPVVIVTGCYAQLEPEEVESIDGVDYVLGSNEKFALFDLIGSPAKRPTPTVLVSEIRDEEAFGPAMSGPTGERTRAYLKVQDGCDYSCSFCTIPLARGLSRSQPADRTMDQARELVARGFKEIVLTGVNVGDYGRKDGTNLLALLEGLMRINGLHRIRISSIEPNLLTDGIIDLAATGSPLCPHFHIPLQSGSDNILRAMRRRYHSGQYRDLITKVRERIPNCGIGVDVITGFPGESDGLFEETYRFLQELPVSYLHVFTYSERPNTPAAALDRSVEPRTRFNRNAMLRVLGKKKKDEFCRSWMGASVTVLTESTVERDHRFGLTANFIRVAIPSDAAGENELVPVRITRVNDDGCIGEVLPAGVLP